MEVHIWLLKQAKQPQAGARALLDKPLLLVAMG
jgi:hypothetical protein